MRGFSLLILAISWAPAAFAQKHLNNTLSDCLSSDSIICENSSSASITTPHITQERRWWCKLKRPFLAKTIGTIVANVEVTLRQTTQSPVALFRFDELRSTMLGGSYIPITVINPDLQDYAEQALNRQLRSETLEGGLAVGEVREDFAALDLRHQVRRVNSVNRVRSPLRFSFDAKTRQLILRERGRIADVVSCTERAFP